MAVGSDNDPATKAIAEMIQQPISDDMIAFVSYKASTVIKCEPRPIIPPSHRSSTDIPALPNFVEHIARKSNVRAGTFLASTVYLDRLEKRLPKEASGMFCTLHRVFLASLIVTSKYVNDASPKNRHWSRCSGCFSLPEVNLMENQLLGLLDYDLRITAQDLKNTLIPLLPISPKSLVFPLPPITNRSSCKPMAKSTAPSRRLVVAPAPPPVVEAKQQLSLFEEQDQRPEMGDYDSDSDSDDEELAEPVMTIPIPPPMATGKALPRGKACNVDSPLDPYTPFSPAIRVPYGQVAYPSQLAVVDIDIESEVDTFLRPFENESKENWLEGLVNNWDEQEDEDEDYDMEEMERDDEEEEEDVGYVWMQQNHHALSNQVIEEEEDDDVSTYSLPCAMVSQPTVHRHQQQVSFPHLHPAPNFPPNARRHSGCSTLSSSSSLSLHTPTDFHNDFTSVPLEAPVISQKRQYGYEIADFDEQSCWGAYKHNGPYDASKRNAMSKHHHNSKQATVYIPPALGSIKEGRHGILARVFRQAARHR